VVDFKDHLRSGNVVIPMTPYQKANYMASVPNYDSAIFTLTLEFLAQKIPVVHALRPFDPKTLEKVSVKFFLTLAVPMFSINVESSVPMLRPNVTTIQSFNHQSQRQCSSVSPKVSQLMLQLPMLQLSVPMFHPMLQPSATTISPTIHC